MNKQNKTQQIRNRDELVTWNCLSNPSRQQNLLLELVMIKRNKKEMK